MHMVLRCHLENNIVSNYYLRGLRLIVQSNIHTALHCRVQVEITMQHIFFVILLFLPRQSSGKNASRSSFPITLQNNSHVLDDFGNENEMIEGCGKPPFFGKDNEFTYKPIPITTIILFCSFLDLLN